MVGHVWISLGEDLNVIVPRNTLGSSVKKVTSIITSLNMTL